jgi:localization factor PodJL
VSAIIQKSAAGSFVVSVPDPADEAFHEGLRAGPDGGWQQTAGIFSAIATMLSLKAHDADRQSRENLIRQLDELETTVRNGAAEDSSRLKVELARLEAELRAWRGITWGSGLDGGAAAPGAEAGEGAGGADGFPVLSETNAAESLSTHRGMNRLQSIGSPEQFDRLTRDIQESFALGLAAADRPLAGRQDLPNRILDGVPAAGIDHAGLDAFSERIEASHRQLTARLEVGLSSAANETNTLKDMIAAAAMKFEQARDAEQTQRVGVILEREIAKLAGRLDHAGEGFASLAVLERAIGGLSVQLEETAQIASGLSSVVAASHAAAGPASAHSDHTQAVLREIAKVGALHESAWQRVHATLADIQQSLEHIAKATRGGTGLSGAALIPTSADPFAPILTSLAQHGQEGPLAARVVRPGAIEKAAYEEEILPAGEVFVTALPQATATFKAIDAVSVQSKDGGEMGSFLIEPGLGFPGRSGDSETRGQSNGPPKVSYDREEPAGHTDFIAAARRAARAAQLQGAAAASGTANPGMGHDGLAAPGGGPVRRSGRSFPLLSRRPLVFWGVLVFAAMGAFAATLAHSRFRESVPELLKRFERAAPQAKPAAASEAPASTRLARQTFPPNPPASPSLASPSQASEPPAGLDQSPVANAAPLDPKALHPLAPVEASFSANGAARSGDSRPSGIAAPTHLIAGSDAIVADTLGRSNGADNAARPRPVAAFPLGAVLPTSATAAAGSPPARAAARNLIEDAKSGDAAAQLELAIRFAEGGPSERNYEMAAQWYGKAAERGLAVAEYRLASLYERGLGVAQDMQRAKNLYQRAAEKGNTRAMHNLGVLAVESADGKPNYTSAALWFGKAAEYGVRDSQYNMAVLLARGLGLPKDLVKSYIWFSIVAAAGDPDAAKKRDDVAARLTSSELASANAAAAAFAPRQADQAANEAAPSAVHLEASPAKPEQSVKPKLSGL